VRHKAFVGLTYYRPEMPFGNRKKNILDDRIRSSLWGAFDSAKNHKRRRKRQSVNAKREKSLTAKLV